MAADSCTRTCSKCGTEKPIDEFHLHNNGPGGRRAQCKACRSKDAAERYLRNRERILAQTIAWGKANPEKRRAAERARRARDPKKYDARTHKYRREHPEKNRLLSLNDYRKHKAKRLAAMRRWREKNPEKGAEQSRRYRAENPERISALHRNYKARTRNAPGRHTADDIARLRKLQNDRCAMPGCGKKLRGKGHVDHRLALARGGSNDPSNLQLLCPSCNMAKKAKDEIEFIQERGFLI